MRPGALVVLAALLFGACAHRTALDAQAEGFTGVTFTPLYTDPETQATFNEFMARIEVAPDSEKMAVLSEITRFQDTRRLPAEVHEEIMLLLRRKGWKAADARARKVLAEVEDTPVYSHAIQIIGSTLLKRHLLRQPATPEVETAIAYYTERLIAARHPDGALLADALEKLDGVWPLEKRRQSARQARLHAQAYLARIAAARCQDDACLRRVADAPELEEAQSAEMEVLHRGVQRLRRMEG